MVTFQTIDTTISRRAFRPVLLFLFFLATVSAHAEGRKGIAFAEAPELSSGMCFGDNAERTLACARAKCIGGGAEERDCLRVKWCFPAMWSADVFMQHKEGPHWHEYLCGWDSRQALEAAAAIACDRQRRDYLIECATVRIWDEEGKEYLGE